MAMSYWATGIAVSCHSLGWGIAGVVVIYSGAMLTALKARVIGHWTTPIVGNTEIRTLIVVYALAQALLASEPFALWFLIVVIIGGRGLIVLGIGAAVREANASDVPPCDIQWQLRPLRRCGAEEGTEGETEAGP